MLILFLIIQSKKTIIAIMNNLTKLRRTTAILNLKLSTLCTKFQHNKILLVLNSLIDFCVDAGESK